MTIPCRESSQVVVNFQVIGIEIEILMVHNLMPIALASSVGSQYTDEILMTHNLMPIAHRE
jgi:hypothetical protein